MDVRNRVIADCASLLPLARSACAAMDEGDEAEVLRLFCGESQKRTLRRLGRLIDDLCLCRTAGDLPGPEPEVVELRNASFKVFRGLSAQVGNPLNLTKHFRSGAVDFFRMLVRRDPVLLQLVHRGPWRRFAYDLLFAAIKANQYLLQLRQVPAALLRPLRSLVRLHSTEDRERTTKVPNGKLELLSQTIRHEHERTRREIIKRLLPKFKARERGSEITQEQVARDFGVSRSTVNRWEINQTANGPENKSNKYGYYKELRTNPDLRGAYYELVNCVKRYQAEKRKADKLGIRFVTFVRFHEEWLKHQPCKM